MNESYFFTWTKQEDAPSLELKETTVDSYITTDGQEVYDLSSCSYHLGLGLRNERLSKVISDQYSTLPVAGPKIVYDLKLQCSKKLKSSLGFKDGKIFYTVSGAESIENALKMARQASGKKHILSREVSYHGATLGALSITGDWRRDGSPTLKEYSHFIPGPEDKDAITKTEETIKQIGADNIAAICLETITGGNGVIIPTQEWYDGISKLCKQYNIYLILDEVVCGFGRTGKDFGFQHYGLKPDFICMAKNISAGFFPFGAVYVSKRVSDYFDKNTLSCGLTNYAHPVGLRLCSEIIDIINEKEFKKNFDQLEIVLKNSITKLETSSKVTSIRQIGLLMAVELSNHELTWSKLKDQGLYINLANNCLIITPIMNTTPIRLEQAMDKLIQILKD